MGFFDFLRGKQLSDKVLSEIAGRCCGAVMSGYDFFNERGLLQDDKTRLQILFRLLGIILLYTDSQIYAARGSEARSDAMEKLVRLVGSALASGLPTDPQYRLTALVEPNLDVDGVKVQTSAYLMGMVQEVFEKYGSLLAYPDGLETVLKDFSNELCGEFRNPPSQDPFSPIEFQMFLMTCLGSMNFKEVL